MTLQIPSAAGYGANAAALAAQYESITFEQVHQALLHLLPTSPVAVLDIGAGSGRDAAALARRGHQVTAVEPTAELRAEGQRRHATLNIEWINDHLPGLQLLRQTQRRFGLILLTAVWMHLDQDEQAKAMAAVAELADDGGHVFMTLRHGPVPEGRRMFDVSAVDTARLAAGHGLVSVHLAERGDMFERHEVRWSVLALQRRSGMAADGVDR